jgi:dihydroorotase-like cyclic amidohydrolase
VKAEHPLGTLADWEQSHPVLSEEEAVVRMSVFAEHTPAQVYLVHLGTGASMRRLREIRHRQANVRTETTSTYLSIATDDPVGMLAKMVPPIRARDDLQALWEGIEDGTLDTIGTDNVTRTLAFKRPELGLAEAGPGYPARATHLPVVLTEGVHKRGLPLEAVVDKLTRGPARIFGIYPRKGTIAVGSDADLAIVDLAHARPADPAHLYSLSDFSLFAEKPLCGWPVHTVKGGVVAFEDGKVTIEPGAGRYIRRALSVPA